MGKFVRVVVDECVLDGCEVAEALVELRFESILLLKAEARKEGIDELT